MLENEFNGDMAQQQLRHLAKVALSWVKVPLSPKFRKKIPVGRREFTLMETWRKMTTLGKSQADAKS